MTNVANRNRQSAGQPTGGEFATEAKGTDTGVSLGAASGLRERIATLPPVDFDTEQATIYGEMAQARSKIDRALSRLSIEVETPEDRRARMPPSRAEMVRRAEAVIADPDAPDYQKDPLRRQLEELDAADSDYGKVRDAFETFNEVFDERGRWSRAFLVSGVDGHVHSSMDCGTCNRMGNSTRFQWMTNYSDHSEDEIVADAGWRACTVCYPSAPIGDKESLPTAMFSAEEKQAEAERAERAAAKGKREADKIAKAPTASGEPLVVRTGPPRQDGGSPWMVTEEFKTERTAMTWYGHSLTYGRKPDTDAAREDIVAALAAKRDVDPAEIRDELEAKAAKKLKKMGMNWTPPDLDEVRRNAEHLRAAWDARD